MAAAGRDATLMPLRRSERELATPYPAQRSDTALQVVRTPTLPMGTPARCSLTPRGPATHQEAPLALREGLAVGCRLDHEYAYRRIGAWSVRPAG